MTKLLPALLLASALSGCLGHQPLTAAGVRSPILLGPVRAIGGSATPQSNVSGEAASLIELDQHIVVPGPFNTNAMINNQKTAEQTLQTLRAEASKQLLISELKCRATMNLFVRTTWCSIDGTLHNAASDAQ